MSIKTAAKKINRRQILQGALLSGAVGSVALAARKFPGPIRDIYDVVDAFNYGLHDLLLSGQPLVREFDRADVAINFPTSGTTSPRDERYQRMLTNNFSDWSYQHFCKRFAIWNRF